MLVVSGKEGSLGFLSRNWVFDPRGRERVNTVAHFRGEYSRTAIA